MEAPHQPSKIVFRPHETTVFTNAAGPSKVVKLVPQATLLDLTWPRKIDLACVWVVKGRGKVEGKVEGKVGAKIDPKSDPFFGTFLGPAGGQSGGQLGGQLEKSA